MSKYIRRETSFPTYYQFPKFLLRAPISQTAKLAYMLLYDRARLSRKNGWITDENVPIVYPIAKLAKKLRKSRTTIKCVLNELEENELLIRKSGGFSKANKLYVLIPETGQFPDTEPVFEPAENPALTRAESRPCEGQISDHEVDGFPAPSNNINKNNISKNILSKRKSSPMSLGRYNNIFLFPEEYDRLCKDFPGRIDGLIDDMSIYCEAKSISYQNYEAALRRWAGKNFGPPEKKPEGLKEYTYKEGESL